jgi:hypothetical protein
VDPRTGALEPGIDAGGLTKEFFSSVLCEVTDDGFGGGLGDGDGSGGFGGFGGFGGDDPGASGASSSSSSSSAAPLAPSGRPLMQRQVSARGQGQPLFRSLPDASLMLTRSNRPPM